MADIRNRQRGQAISESLKRNKVLRESQNRTRCSSTFNYKFLSVTRISLVSNKRKSSFRLSSVKFRFAQHFSSFYCLIKKKLGENEYETDVALFHCLRLVSCDYLSHFLYCGWWKSNGKTHELSEVLLLHLLFLVHLIIIYSLLHCTYSISSKA